MSSISLARSLTPHFPAAQPNDHFFEDANYRALASGMINPSFNKIPLQKIGEICIPLSPVG